MQVIREWGCDLRVGSAMIVGHVSAVRVPLGPAWVGLSRRSSAWKDAEILLLRHQVALLERRSAARSKLT